MTDLPSAKTSIPSQSLRERRLACETGSRAVPSSVGFGSGVEWVIDALECDADRLADLDTISQLCDQVVNDLGLNVVGLPQTHKFPPPGGVTALYLLSESHLACHTYPEHGLATFNLYCCRARPAWDWVEKLTEHLGASKVDVVRLARGLASESNQMRGAK